MKALVIALHVYEGFMDFVHDGGQTQSRLLVPDAGNLCIWIYSGGVFVDHEFDPNEQKHDVVREIEIAEDVVREVIDFKQVEKSLHEKIEKLLPEKE